MKLHIEQATHLDLRPGVLNDSPPDSDENVMLEPTIVTPTQDTCSMIARNGTSQSTLGMPESPGI